MPTLCLWLGLFLLAMIAAIVTSRGRGLRFAAQLLLYLLIVTLIYWFVLQPVVFP